MRFECVEKWLRLFGGAGAVLFVVVLYLGLWRAAHHAKGREVGHVSGVARNPFGARYVALALGAIGFLAWLWKPLPVALSRPLRVAADVAGGITYAAGLVLMLWGRFTLGEMYNVSSGTGAQLYADHRLVTSGPFALVRHPMYLGGMLAEIGALLLYRTWATALIAVNAPALLFRAHQEEQALAVEFGEQWVAYRRRVPLLVPRLGRLVGP